MFLRETPEERTLTAVNAGDAPCPLPWQGPARDLLSGQTLEGSLTLPPRSGLLLA